MIAWAATGLCCVYYYFLLTNGDFDLLTPEPYSWDLQPDGMEFVAQPGFAVTSPNFAAFSAQAVDLALNSIPWLSTRRPVRPPTDRVPVAATRSGWRER